MIIFEQGNGSLRTNAYIPYRIDISPNNVIPKVLKDMNKKPNALRKSQLSKMIYTELSSYVIKIK